jgi:hypothetical protein
MQAITQTRTLCLASLTAILIAGCATPPPRHASYRMPPPIVAAPRPQIYFYALKSQTPEQVDRDRFECNDWAVKQTGYDPSVPEYAPTPVGHLHDTAPARDTVGGAVTGAAVGAIVSDPGHAGTGAAVGAVAGAILGSVADTQRQEAIDNANAARDARAQRAAGVQSNRYNNYVRALSACGSARGYDVR